MKFNIVNREFRNKNNNNKIHDKTKLFNLNSTLSSFFRIFYHVH